MLVLLILNSTKIIFADKTYNPPITCYIIAKFVEGVHSQRVFNHQHSYRNAIWPSPYPLSHRESDEQRLGESDMQEN